MVALMNNHIILDRSETSEKINAEYIWFDGFGTDMRNRAMMISGSVTDPSQLPMLKYDGLSTGEITICPRAIFKDPFRRGNNNILVICHCYTAAGDPVLTNTPEVAADAPPYGLKQEYTLLQKKDVKGPYYAGKSSGRKVVDAHSEACVYAGINISRIDGEVLHGQWEFQVGPSVGISASDELCVARYILEGIAEKEGVVPLFDPNPILVSSCSIFPTAYKVVEKPIDHRETANINTYQKVLARARNNTPRAFGYFSLFVGASGLLYYRGTANIVPILVSYFGTLLGLAINMYTLKAGAARAEETES